MNKKIPFFDYPRLYLDNEKELNEIFKDVSSRGSFILQKDLEKFEDNLSAYTGAKHAVGVGNATDALEIALKVAGIKPNDEIIISTHTMIATAGAINHVGALAVPVDIRDDHLIDYSQIEKNITAQTKAIMPTQLNGRTCNMDIICDIADKYNLLLFEDAAQGLGSKFKNKSAGTFGLASAISFYPAKNLGSLGDGGAILVNDETLYKEIISYRDHGRDPISGKVISWGVNSRLDNLQAAFLNYFLSKYDTVINRRRYIANLYYENLKNVEELYLPPTSEDSDDHFDVFQNYEIRAKSRDSLRKFLLDHNIGTLIQWAGMAIHHHQNLGFNQTLTRADEFFKHILMLPMNMFVTDEDIIYISQLIKKFYNQVKK